MRRDEERKIVKTSSKSDLFSIFLKFKTSHEVKFFLSDICTPSELQTLARRWEVAKLLDQRKTPYRDIAKATGASVTTVTRVARFLKFEPYQGYRRALDLMRKTKNNGQQKRR